MNALKRQIVQAAYSAGGGHVPSAFSILDIVWVLYTNIIRSEDVFILSKGHGCLALYAVLAERGIIPENYLVDFASYTSILGGHPDRTKIPGVECSTGSLGHGLPQAVGIALAKKINGEAGRVFCLVGDGECNEGSIWEAALLAGHHNLNNLVVIVDHNHSTENGADVGSLPKKFEAFSFGVRVAIGHDQTDLTNALIARHERPRAIIAYTTKGKGCARMVADPMAWHHRAPNKQELEEILKELS